MKKINTAATRTASQAAKGSKAAILAGLHTAATPPAFVAELKKNANLLFRKGWGQFVMPPHPLLTISSLSVTREAEYNSEDDINRVYRMVGTPELAGLKENDLVYSEVSATLTSVVAAQETKLLGRLLILRDNNLMLFVDGKKNVYPVYS